MPLENDIQNLTTAINRLADVFAGTAAQVAGGAKGSAMAAESAPELADEMASAAIAKAPKKVAAKPEAVPAPVKAKPENKADDLDVPVVDFEEVKTVLRELGAKMAEIKGATEGRQVVIDLLTEFKVAKAVELKGGQFSAFIKRANELMAANDAGGVEVENEDDLVG